MPPSGGISGRGGDEAEVKEAAPRGEGVPSARVLSIKRAEEKETGETSGGVIMAGRLEELVVAAGQRRIRDGHLRGDWVNARIPAFDAIAELLPRRVAPAVVPSEAGRPVWTHAALRATVERWAGAGGRAGGGETTRGEGGTSDRRRCEGGRGAEGEVPRERCRGGGLLGAMGVPPGARVGVVVPNGPDLAVALAVVMSSRVALPVNAQLATASEVAADLADLRCDAVLYMAPRGEGPRDRSRVEQMRRLAATLGAAALELRTDASVRSGPVQAPTFEIERYDGTGPMKMTTTTRASFVGGGAADDVAADAASGGGVALVLHTSGSTGRKKAVPVTARQLAVGGVCVAASQLLTPSDVCCNAMPLFHVGGVVRNLVAPLLSGGATIAMPFFDPVDFWSAATRLGCTWYYASPTVHAAIAAAAEGIEPTPAGSINRVRLVANAAGPLPLAVAASLERCFPSAVVMPSYGMTECMPVACPPPPPPPSTTGTNHRPPRHRAGSSGQAVGPEISIRDDTGRAVIGRGPDATGHISLRGCVVMSGYERGGGGGGDDDDDASEDPNEGAFWPDGWFKTGDLGWMDEEGYLYVTGRCKEVINRGGETISPHDVEHALIGHPGVSDVVAVSAPHATLQECVAAVVVPRGGLGGLFNPERERREEEEEEEGDEGCTGYATRGASSFRPPGLTQLCLYASRGGGGNDGPPDGPRRSARTALHPTKWPFVLVLVDEIPRGPTGKVSRIRLAKALALPEVSDATRELDRTFVARRRDRSSSIQGDVLVRVEADASVRSDPDDAYDDWELTPATDHPLWRATGGETKEGADDGASTSSSHREDEDPPLSTTQTRVASVWSDVLGVDAGTLTARSDFFAVGGSSLAAGRLAGTMRDRFGIFFTGADVFSHRTLADMGELIDAHEDERRIRDGGVHQYKVRRRAAGQAEAKDRIGEGFYEEGNGFDASRRKDRLGCGRVHTYDGRAGNRGGGWGKSRGYAGVDLGVAEGEGGGGDAGGWWHHVTPHSSRSFPALFVQSLPLLLLHPMRRVACWTVFVVTWVHLENLLVLEWETEAKAGGGRRRWEERGRVPVVPDPAEGPGVPHRRLVSLMTALLVTAAVRWVVFPILAVGFKWIVLGRLKPGVSRLWGGRYLRWWLVDQVLRFSGRGVFRLTPGLVRLRLRMLGAAVGPGAVIHPDAEVGEAEADLLAIGAGAAIDPFARVRATVFASGAMRTARVTIGVGATMCVRSSAGPGADLPAGACVGPCSSVLELHEGTPDQSHLARTRQPNPRAARRLLIGWPTVAAVRAAALTPWLLALWFLVAPVLREVVEEERRGGPGARHPLELGDTWSDGVDASSFPGVSSFPDGAARDIFSAAAPTGYHSSPPPSPPPPPPHHLSAIRRRTWHGTVRWFMVPERLALYFLLRVMHKTLTPWVQLAATVAAKRLVVGAFTTKTAADPLTDWELTRRWIMRTLMPDADLCGTLPLVGTHYETVSCVFRALGAKVGARVFWPGSGVYVADGAYDLLAVGDDAVWGSRSLLFPTNCRHALPIEIRPGANVADRCVLQAGVTVEAEACLGSGALAAEGFTFPEGSTWVGSRDGNAVLLERGGRGGGDGDTAETPAETLSDAEEDEDSWTVRVRAESDAGSGDESTSSESARASERRRLLSDSRRGRRPKASPPPPGVRPLHPTTAPSRAKPFGRAVYGAEGFDNLRYLMPPWWLWPAACTLWEGLVAAFRSCPMVLTWFAVTALLGRSHRPAGRDHEPGLPPSGDGWSEVHLWRFVGVVQVAYAVIHLAEVLVAYGVDVGAKWALLGRRRPGEYSWDASSYCLRWNVYLVACAIRREMLDYLRGSEYINVFFRCLGANIGRDVCLYPTGASPMMTEPDLVHVGDGACVNAAHVICHANTKGAFTLNEIRVGARATLCNDARIMGGVEVMEDATLLEHTMAMAGDVVCAGDTWQGWPVRTVVAGSPGSARSGGGVSAAAWEASDEEAVETPLLASQMGAAPLLHSEEASER